MEPQQRSEAGEKIKQIMRPDVPSTPIAMAGGIVGGIIGGVMGYFAFKWMVSQGFYGLAIPGALVGLGFGALSRRPMIAGGIASAVIGLAVMLWCEWKTFPFVKDDSLSFFLQNLSDLNGATWLFLVLGTVMAFWFGRGR